ncbi:MAG: hypothetical protein KF889_25505 [Alphaproteobacteria bacterium]|nr:hypothetical protein [Alphaproteobacteria bacterium]MCW5739648.1 hypothetical protein [Alphaproteobacteria bacterium]
MTPARTAKGSPFARNMLAGGGITPCRDAPAFINDRRSLIAGAVLYACIAIVAMIVVAVAAAV